MTEWLVHRFIHDADQTDRPDVRGAHGTLASIVCIVCNILLCTTKGLVGLAAGSVSVVADAVNNLTDASSNIVSLIGFKLASRPADKEHPYGHGRIEYMAGVVVAFIIVAVGLDLAKASIQKIAHPEPTDFSPAVVVALLLSIGVKAWMARFNHALARRIDSVTLEATSQDSKNDVLATSAVLAAGVVGKIAGIDLDGLAGLAVGAFIVWSGFELVRDTLDPLLGQAPDPKLVSHIHDTIMSYPGVLGTHDLMVHDYGPGRKFASAHVEMAAEIDPIRSHEVLDSIEHYFEDEEDLPLVLHYDPIVTFDPEDHDLRHWVSDQVKTIDGRLTVHDVRTTRQDGTLHVSLDCVRPHDLPMTDEELSARICKILHRRCADAVCHVTVDSSYVSTGV
ncbi:MAG: cation diffusion facilitator family transporter [Parafannyhessea umbonata]|uniref:cation diffusion facilitator family transporter n=1 Tax=Parafannyhessea umbonata TaxID=604330 RepID=UPI0026EC7765|nr:cation diffusion facilitator family transporter [Parafannyhessea umbonata]MDD6566232.1 cation diffusion facilitator family transporter [Parafannyhessea umbonata]